MYCTSAAVDYSAQATAPTASKPMHMHCFSLVKRYTFYCHSKHMLLFAPRSALQHTTHHHQLLPRSFFYVGNAF